MGKFKIIRTDDPSQYKESIFDLWDKNLEKTPHARFAWLAQGNPAGKTQWILAIDPNNCQLVGTISLMSKEIIQKGQIYRGVIMGDFMVHSDYRVYGPAIMLIKKALEYVKENELHFMYTIPNEASKRLVKGSGLVNETKIVTYVKILSTEYYLRKKIPKVIADIFSRFFDVLLWIYSKESYLWREEIGFEEKNKADDSIEVFCQNMKCLKKIPSGNRSSAFVNWRYFQNPLKKYHLLVCKRKFKEQICGYVFYSFDDEHMSIDDFCCSKENDCDFIMKEIIAIGRRHKVRSIYFPVSEKGDWPRKLKPFRFFNSKEEHKVHWLIKTDFKFEHYDIYNGDRNL